MSKTASTAPRPWLFGPAPDLLFGCGLAYMLFLVYYLLVRTTDGAGNALNRYR